MQLLLQELLPAKCKPAGTVSKGTSSADGVTDGCTGGSAPHEESGQTGSDAADGDGKDAEGCVSEFVLGVDELAKTKLEKPKKLGEEDIIILSRCQTGVWQRLAGAGFHRRFFTDARGGYIRQWF